MSAVATKPRARKTGTPAALRTIADVRNDLASVGQMLNTAYGIAPAGEPIEAVLDHLMHDMLPAAARPIFATYPTRADTHATYEALFKPLACLHAAIALAVKTVLHPTLTQAFALLDSLQTELDDVGPIARALPAPLADHAAQDFVRGRDIAIKMIEEGRALSGERECYRQHRDAGIAQDNFVDRYLSDIIAEPALRRGFTSVLSQIVGSGETFTGGYFRHLSLAETRGGKPGEDGTQPGDAEPAAAEPTQSEQPSTSLLYDFDAYCVMLQARDVAKAAAESGEEMPTAAVLWALVTLIEVALEKTRAATKEGGTLDVCRDASAKVEEAISVAQLLNGEGGAGMEMLYVLDTLLKLATQGLDALERQMLKAAA